MCGRVRDQMLAMGGGAYPESLFGRVSFLQSQLSGNKVRIGRSSRKMSSKSSSSSAAGSRCGMGSPSHLFLGRPSGLLREVLPHFAWTIPSFDLSHSSFPTPTPQPCASCCGPLTCSQNQLLFPGLLSQGFRQMAAAQESSDTGWPMANVPGPLVTRQPHWALPEPSLTALSLQLCLELVHCVPRLEGQGRTEQDLRKLGAIQQCLVFLGPI